MAAVYLYKKLKNDCFRQYTFSHLVLINQLPHGCWFVTVSRAKCVVITNKEGIPHANGTVVNGWIDNVRGRPFISLYKSFSDCWVWRYKCWLASFGGLAVFKINRCWWYRCFVAERFFQSKRPRASKTQKKFPFTENASLKSAVTSKCKYQRLTRLWLNIKEDINLVLPCMSFSLLYQTSFSFSFLTFFFSRCVLINSCTFRRWVCNR